MLDINAIQQAISLTQQGKYKEAEIIYNKLIEHQPDEPILLSAAGLFYVSLKNYDKAVNMLEKSYNINKTAGVVSSLGFALYEKREYKKASLILKEALTYGDNPDLYNKLISCLFEIKNYKDAVNFSNKMYELYPNDVRAVSNKIKALTQSGKLAEAEKMCIDFLRQNQNEAVLWFQLGYLKELIYCNDMQALECYNKAKELGVKSADYNIAVSYQKLGQKGEAEKFYREMLKNFPNDTETQTSLGMCLLSQKKFEEGYELFYNRDSKCISNYAKNLYKPKTQIPNEVIVVCDQGFGDHIQFIRYLPLVPAEKVKVACPKTLKKLFLKNYPKYEFIDYNEIPDDITIFRVSDLAYILGIDFMNIPFAEGYLNATPQIINNKNLKVGLCWEAGAAGIRTMINRTIHIKCFEPFFNINNIQLYSFQYDDTFGGNEKYPQMINLAKDFQDFSDTASALKAMDVVVTVDTSVAHLAGALGVKTYLLLPYASDWRWFDDTSTTPWYNSVQIFKQNDPISWEKPLKEIMEKLSNSIN